MKMVFANNGRDWGQGMIAACPVVPTSDIRASRSVIRRVRAGTHDTKRNIIRVAANTWSLGFR